jgi:hypothetical protein
VTCRPAKELVLSKEKPIPYQPPLPPNEAPSGVDAAAGVTPVGLRPPFVTPAAALSHPDYRGIPILIVAPHQCVIRRNGDPNRTRRLSQKRQSKRRAPSAYPADRRSRRQGLSEFISERNASGGRKLKRGTRRDCPFRTACGDRNALPQLPCSAFILASPRRVSRKREFY